MAKKVKEIEREEVRDELVDLVNELETLAYKVKQTIRKFDELD